MSAYVQNLNPGPGRTPGHFCPTARQADYGLEQFEEQQVLHLASFLAQQPSDHQIPNQPHAQLPQTTQQFAQELPLEHSTVQLSQYHLNVVHQPFDEQLIVQLPQTNQQFAQGLPLEQPTAQLPGDYQTAVQQPFEEQPTAQLPEDYQTVVQELSEEQLTAELPQGQQPAGNDDVQVSPPTSRTREYSLKIVLDNAGARTCGLGDKDRRYITPKPLVKIEVRDSLTGKEMDYEDENLGNLILQVDLWKEDGSSQCNILDVTDVKKMFADSATVVEPVTEDAVITAQPVASTPLDDVASAGSSKAAEDETPRVPRTIVKNLVGNTFFTPEFIPKDTKAKERGMWCEIKQMSIRMRGKYRLHFKLFDVSNALDAAIGNDSENQFGPSLATAFSEVVCVQVPRDIVRQGLATKKRSGTCTQVPESNAKRQKTQPTPKSNTKKPETQPKPKPNARKPKTQSTLKPNARKQTTLKGKQRAAPVQPATAAEDTPVATESVSPIDQFNPNSDIIVPSTPPTEVDPSPTALDQSFLDFDVQGTAALLTEGSAYKSLAHQSNPKFVFPTPPAEVHHSRRALDQSYLDFDMQGTTTLSTEGYAYNSSAHQSNPNFVSSTIPPVEVDYFLTTLDQSYLRSDAHGTAALPTEGYFDAHGTVALPTEEYAHGSDFNNKRHSENSTASLDQPYLRSDAPGTAALPTEGYFDAQGTAALPTDEYAHGSDFNNKRYSEDSTDSANSSDSKEPSGQEDLNQTDTFFGQFVEDGDYYGDSGYSSQSSTAAGLPIRVDSAARSLPDHPSNPSDDNANGRDGSIA